MRTRTTQKLDTLERTRLSDWVTFRDTIKAARKRLKLSQSGAAKAWGVPLRTLQNWEAGDRKPPDWVIRLIVEKIEEKA